MEQLLDSGSRTRTDPVNAVHLAAWWRCLPAGGRRRASRALIGCSQGRAGDDPDGGGDQKILQRSQTPGEDRTEPEPRRTQPKQYPNRTGPLCFSESARMEPKTADDAVLTSLRC